MLWSSPFVSSKSAKAVLFGVAALIFLAQRVNANDLLQLYRLALAQDARLEGATAQRDASIEVRPQALSQLLPQFGIGASVGREHAGYETPAIASGPVPNCVLSASAQMERCYSSTYGYGLTLQQTLWSFESFSRLREANSLVASAQATLLAAQQELLLRVATAYFGILSAQDQLATNRRAREAFGNLLQEAKVREHTGIGARSAVDQAQSFYDATEQSVIDAENLLSDADLTLREIVDSQIADIVPLREDIPLVPPDPASVDAWVAAARRDNPSVRAAELQAEAADRDIAVQRGRGLPNVTLNGGSSHSWQDPAFGGNQTLDTVGVFLNWPLFQGGAVASAMRQSRALYRQAQAQYDSAQRDAERRTRAAYRDVMTGIMRISAARRAVESGREAVDASERNVEFGMGSVFDLLNAQNNYYAAERAYSQTRYDYLTAVLTLKQQAGSLAERDLERIDSLLVTKTP
jgi:outer membrane protein